MFYTGLEDKIKRIAWDEENEETMMKSATVDTYLGAAKQLMGFVSEKTTIEYLTKLYQAASDDYGN